MDENISIAYSLHRYTSSKDSDLIKGLNIYSKNIEPTIRTNTSEILFWLDEYNKLFSDFFFVFGFYQNKKLIGFTQVALFKEEGILVIDYMVIDEPFRGNNTFFEFTSQVRKYFINYAFNYVIAEIVYNNEGPEPSEKSKNLIRLLKIAHFKVIKAPYYQPMLGVTNFESEMKAVLMIYNVGDHDRIKKETYNMIVNTIYYKHYLRWYDKFLIDQNKINYINALGRLFAKIQSEIEDKSFIELNGHHHLPTESPVIPKKTLNKFLVASLVILLFLILFSGLILLHLFLKNKLNIESNVQIAILVASVVGCLVFLAFLFKRDENIINRLIDKILDKLN